MEGFTSLLAFDEIDLQIKHGKMPKLDMVLHYIVSWLPQRLESAKLSIEDGNGKVLKTKSIDYTDFPLPEIKILLQVQPLNKADNFLSTCCPQNIKKKRL